MEWAYVLYVVAGLFVVFIATLFFEKNYEETTEGTINKKYLQPNSGRVQMEDYSIDFGAIDHFGTITVKFQINQPQNRLFKTRKVTIQVPNKALNMLSVGDKTMVFVTYGKITGLVKSHQLLGSSGTPDGFYIN